MMPYSDVLQHFILNTFGDTLFFVSWVGLLSMDYVAYIAFLDLWEAFSPIPLSHLRQTVLWALLSHPRP